LRDAGARVVEARDGVEALELAKRDAPDLILADADIPRLDGLGLCAAIRRDRSLDAVPVVLLAERGGKPPRALAEAGCGSRALVDSVLEALHIPGATEEEAPFDGETEDASTNGSQMGRQLEEPVGFPWQAPAVARRSPLMTDPLERENMRAQSAVAMHREPANRAPRATYPIWRLSLGPGAPAAVLSSGFDAQILMISRVLGAGFIALLVGTVVILFRSQWLSTTSQTSSSPAAPPAQTTKVERIVVEVPVPESQKDAGALHAFSGALRPGVDPALDVGQDEGVLELDGPSTVRAEIDGVDRGPLPIELVLQEGRHAVRYRAGSRATVRFYVVKPGATRVLRVVTLPGGLIDAR
jgi:CheY-like chemotaxis protein